MHVREIYRCLDPLFGSIKHSKKERAWKRERHEKCAPTNKCLPYDRLKSRIVPKGEENV